MDRQTLKDAQTLALFSNLTEENAEYFRQNYADFVPASWWTIEEYEGTLIWQLWQQLLQESWTELSADRIIALLIMWSVVTGSSESSEVAGVRDIPTAFPYQRAVMFIAMEPWRAKFCANCGQRFVKEKPSQKFCGDACFKESRKTYKRALWAEHPEWLKNRKRGKKSRRSADAKR